MPYGSPVWILDQSALSVSGPTDRKIDQLELSDLGTLVIAVDMNVFIRGADTGNQEFPRTFSGTSVKMTRISIPLHSWTKAVLEQVRHQTGAYHTIITHGHSYLVLKGSLKS